MSKEYIGNSVYADFFYGSLMLTTENGRPGDDPSNRIYLEPETIEALFKFWNAERSK